MNIQPPQQAAPPQRANGFGADTEQLPGHKEVIQNLLARWQALKAHGATEATNPEFAKISRTLSALSKQQEMHRQRMQQQQMQMQQMQMLQGANAGTGAAAPTAGQPAMNPMMAQNGQFMAKPQAAMQPTPAQPKKPSSRPGSAVGNSPVPNNATPFTVEQLQILRNQITAFKMISKNVPIPPALQAALFSTQVRNQAQQSQQPGQFQGQQQAQFQRKMDSPSQTPKVAPGMQKPTGYGQPAVNPATLMAGGRPASMTMPQGMPQGVQHPGAKLPGGVPQGMSPAMGGQPMAPVRSQTPLMKQSASPAGMGQGMPLPGAPKAMPGAPSGGPKPAIDIVSPYSHLAEPISFADFSSRQHRLLIPSIMPTGVDIVALRDEREKAIAHRINARVKELENMPANVAGFNVHKDLAEPEEPKSATAEAPAITAGPSAGETGATEADGADSKALALAGAAAADATDDLANKKDDLSDEIKVRALIELKGLKLLAKQRAMRKQVLQNIAHFNTLVTTGNRFSFRRMKKQSLREARLTEQLERQQRMEREKREHQKHVDYLMGVCAHGNEVINSGRIKRSKAQRLGKAVMGFHAHTEREEQRRAERTAKQRLQALKANDEEAYMKLLDQTKDTRITHLLRQTNAFLNSLALAVKDQQRDARLRQPDGGQREPTKDEEEEEEGGDNLDYYAVAHKVSEEVTKQPSILVGGTLKEYQIKGLQWMVSLYNNNLNGILADEMGLGKTIQTISLITYLIEAKQQTGPYLVIVPLSTLTNWTLEFEKWAPTVKKVVYKGPPLARKAQQAAIRSGDFQVLLTTYEYIIKDRPILSRLKWVHMIIDEGHRMKNASSKLSSTLTQYYHSRFRLILTGTPLQNNLPELWALLNFVLPKIFNSVKSFDEWFNTPFANTGGQDKMELSEEETLLIIRRLHKVLRPFLLRRLKKDVEKDLPDKVEKVIKCKMSSLQQRLYQQMVRHNVLFIGEGANGASKTGLKGLNNQIMQLRKICNHPFVFEEVENLVNPERTTNDLLWRTAGKFELLDRMLPKFKETGHRVLIFFQMTQIMDIMEDFLRLKGMEYLRLDGGTKADERSDLLKKFNAPNSPYFAFLLSTRAGGLGLNLQTADTVIIYDTDWNPHQDLQAQDRAHRIGQTKEVRIFRLITEDSVEEMILQRAHQKLDIDGKVIQAGKFDNKSTSEEQEAFLRSLLEAEEAKKGKGNEEDDELDDEELNEILARDDDEGEVFREMDMERIRLSAYGKGKTDRLFSEAELPDVYKRDIVVEMIQESAEEVQGRGARKRKVTKYDDGLTEKQWLDAIDNDEDSLEDAIERQNRRQQRRTKKAKH
ncbi:SNF2 family N-terminal domain-containing protein [Dipodascopsis tothii]|uniref:SNF2 family N-terminal domain-containing protein n=1 Tax=Dipodascopsis tothii TaxID=44089 RepID=UPI0034CD926C